MPSLAPASLSNRPRVYNALHKLRLARALTQTAEAERGALCRHLATCSTAVEIGTFMGVTAARMAHALPAHGKLFCIDPYPQADSLLAIARREVGREGVAERIIFLRCESDGARHLLPETVDFAFVDGDHSYEGLRKDWELVTGILRVGGIAAFHDTTHVAGSEANSPGAIRFYEEVIARDPDFEQVERILTLNIVRRKRRA